MTADELRELAGGVTRADLWATKQSADYLRACADALDAGRWRGAFDGELAALGYRIGGYVEQKTQAKIEEKWKSYIEFLKQLHLAVISCPGHCGALCPNHHCPAHNGDMFIHKNDSEETKQAIHKINMQRRTYPIIIKIKEAKE